MAKKTSSKVAKKPTRKKSAKKPAKKPSQSQSPSGLLDPGAKAPSFTLPDQSGALRSLKEYAGQPVILFFYPKDDTEDCTKEACDFNSRRAALARFGGAVLGISRLTVKSKAKFAAKHGITYPLLADEDGSVSSRYGTWVEKSMYGKKFMAVSRTTYLIDRDGTIARRWDKVEVDGHVAEVLAAAKSL